MNDKTYTFEAEINKVSDLDGAYIEFPYDIRKEFGKGRMKKFTPSSTAYLMMGVLSIWE